MNLKYIISLCISLLILCSCSDSSDTTYDPELAKDAQIYTFSMQGVHNKEGDSIPRAQDSLRFLVFNKTNFAINQIGGYIYNPDSLPYGIEFKNKVKLTLTTNPTTGSEKIEIKVPDSTYTWNTTDSIDISKMPITIYIHAWAGNVKEYKLNLLIHQVDPDLFVWNNMGTLPQSAEAQKALLVGGDFYTYTAVSGSVKLFKSNKNSLSWTEEAVSVLPSSVILNSIYYFNSQFIAVSEEGNSYVSTDGANWSQQSNGAKVAGVYGVIPGKSESEDELLLLVDNAGEYVLATTRDMVSIEYPGVTGLGGKDLIPLKDFASATNYDRSSKSKYLVLTGGTSATGQDLNSTLLFEKTTSGSISIMRSVKNNLFKGKGLSLFFYTDNYMYVIAENQFYRSNSWGEKWEKAPSKQVFDEAIALRTEQSVVVDNENIWLFGGKDMDAERYLNDVWKGRLNSFK